jgi:hypothetical protein
MRDEGDFGFMIFDLRFENREWKMVMDHGVMDDKRGCIEGCHASNTLPHYCRDCVVIANEGGRCATNDGLNAVAVWPSPSLPKNTEVLRDPLPLRAHVPMGEGKRKDAGDLKQ